MEALGQRVSEVCVLSINATNRRALSVNECVYVCVSFLPVSASVSFSTSPGLERTIEFNLLDG